jgi:hypothetical protein
MAETKIKIEISWIQNGRFNLYTEIPVLLLWAIVFIF